MKLGSVIPSDLVANTTLYKTKEIQRVTTNLECLVVRNSLYRVMVGVGLVLDTLGLDDKRAPSVPATEIIEY